MSKVEICGVNTADLPVLKNDKMVELLKRIQKGDKEARAEFIKGNLRLVLSVVQRFSHRAENMDDLFQVGCIGLMKSIDHFDLSQNVRFSTYAVPMIIGEIRRHLRDNHAIRISRSMRDLAYRALQVKEEISIEKNREATIQEIAEKMEIPPEEIVCALDAIQDLVSLHEPVYQDGNDAILVMDQVQDGKNHEENWLKNILLKEAVVNLNEREKNILYMRYYDGKTQVEVANEIGISQAQVSRLEKGALSRIKQQI